MFCRRRQVTAPVASPETQRAEQNEHSFYFTLGVSPLHRLDWLSHEPGWSRYHRTVAVSAGRRPHPNWDLSWRNRILAPPNHTLEPHAQRTVSPYSGQAAGIDRLFPSTASRGLGQYVGSRSQVLAIQGTPAKQRIGFRTLPLGA